MASGSSGVEGVARRLGQLTGTDPEMCELTSQVEAVAILLRMKNERIAELEGALLKLANEVGAMTFRETAVRLAIGYTNWGVLMERETEARAKLGTGGYRSSDDVADEERRAFAPKKKRPIQTTLPPGVTFTDEKEGAHPHAAIMRKLDEINRRLKWLGGDDQAADPLEG